MTKPTHYPTVNFRLSDKMAADLEARSGSDHGTTRHATAKRDLERYHELVRRELAAAALSEAEVMLLLDVSNGTLWEPHSIPMLWAEVDDSVPELADKWEVDGPAFVLKLRGLGLGATFALVDGLERTWNSIRHHGGDLKAAARVAGLLSAKGEK